MPQERDAEQPVSITSLMDFLNGKRGARHCANCSWEDAQWSRRTLNLWLNKLTTLSGWQAFPKYASFLTPFWGRIADSLSSCVFIFGSCDEGLLSGVRRFGIGVPETAANG